MNTLSKIFLVIIIILAIMLGTMTVLYLKERDIVYEYLENYNFTYEEDNDIDTNGLDGNFLFSVEGE